MSYATRPSITLILISIILFLGYQNCNQQKSSTSYSGQGQPYGGLKAVTYYHVNDSSNDGPVNSVNSKIQKLNSDCVIDGKIEYENNTYRLYSNICNQENTSQPGQEISSNSIQKVSSLPLISYNNWLWQEATTDDFANENFFWYLSACLNAEGVNINLNDPIPTTAFAEMQIKKKNKDLSSANNEQVHITITQQNIGFPKTQFIFDQIEKSEITNTQGPFMSTKTITRKSTSDITNSSLILTTVQHLIQGQVTIQENYLLMKELQPTKNQSLQTYFDGQIFCK